jgi:hypothetical protein
MASKRRIRRNACTGKVKHDTQAQAVSHVINTRKRRLTGNHPYKCPFCHGWHIGHTPKRMKQGMRAKFRRGEK